MATEHGPSENVFPCLSCWTLGILIVIVRSLTEATWADKFDWTIYWNSSHPFTNLRFKLVGRKYVDGLVEQSVTVKGVATCWNSKNGCWFSVCFFADRFCSCFFPRKTRSFLWLRHDLKPRALCAKLHQALKIKLGNLLQIWDDLKKGATMAY